MNSDKINAIMIVEVIGKPAEHLVETLKDIISKISEESGVEVTRSRINEPVLLKDQKDFYSSFADIEIEADTMKTLSRLMFRYMPAHVDVLYPEKLSIDNNDFGEMMNDILKTLHGYDEVARVIEVEKKILENKLKQLMPKEEKKE